MCSADKIGITILLFIIVFVLGVLGGDCVRTNAWEQECVERGFGHYEPDRTFKWDDDVDSLTTP